MRLSERDSSGTTVGASAPLVRARAEGDGADSPTQAAEGSAAARPNLMC